MRWYRRNNNLAAWWCFNCGRVEAQRDNRICPNCGEKMQRSSRYEWFLADELKNLLSLLCDDRKWSLTQQFPIEDHRGFIWYWDIAVRIEGRSIYGGYTEVIDVNGIDHTRQKKYSGPGGGYTRDQDKSGEIFSPFMEQGGIRVI